MELMIEYNEETGTWEEHKEPYITLEIPTEKDYNRLQEMISYWKEHHKEEADNE